MPGLKKYFPDVRFGGNKVGADEIDIVQQYTVIYPTVSATWVGTSAGGTAGVDKPLVIVQSKLDYPRNLLYSVVGTNDMGGTWTVNGKNQFGQSITESVVLGTAAAGTPAVATSGTSIFREVSSGTFTATSTAVGLGSARVGVSIGAGTALFGLPFRIGGSTDVKSITWSDNGTVKGINGGTIGAYSNSTVHAFQGTSAVAATDIYTVTAVPTYNAEYVDNIA